MLYDGNGSRSPHPRPHIRFPFRTPRRLSRRHLVLFVLMSLVILSGVIAGWSVGVLSTHAAGPIKSAPAGMTFQQFLNEGSHDSTYRGHVIPPSHVAPPPGKGSQHYANQANQPPSVEPATMQPITSALTSTFLASNSSSAALDLKGSDGRLEVQIRPGSLDLSHATVSSGGSPVGALSVHLVQVHGHYVGQMSVLGSYQLQLVDSQGKVITDMVLHAPMTIIYHYQPSELAGLGIDPGRVVLTWPTLNAAALRAKKPTTGLTIPMQNNPVAHTLTAQTSVIDPSPFASMSTPADQSLPALHLASVQGNSGQSSYSYPLQVPPGTGGFTPQLNLTYSSAGPNERHSTNSPAGDEGDGWSLNLGSISAEVYPTTPTSTTWYFLNNVANVGDRLIPTSNNYFDTEHISYLKIQQINPGTATTCFHVWDRSGTYYELGCTADSLQYWTDSTGTRTNYRWDVNKIVAPNEGPNSTYFKVILPSYVQDTATTNGYTTIRDAALKQIIYGDGKGTTSSATDVAGTVDFQYHGQNTISSTSGDSPRSVTWVQAYGTNYDCITAPPKNTTLRCDDPLDNGNEKAPLVMSTLTLDTVTSYVGSDAGTSPSYEDASYTFNYYANPPFADAPFKTCTDPLTLAQQYCAGEHHLISIIPTIYQNHVGHILQNVNFGYASPLNDTYYDSLQTVGSQPYQTQTSWDYLTFYQDLNTGVGGRITYATAYNNTRGTPTVKNGTSVTDDRYDALYCTTHASDPDPTLRCTGNYAHPDDHAWSEQVVTSITALGTDSSASSLQPAKTTFSYYRLANTGTYSGSGVWCYPDQYQVDKDCVGDNWLPKNDSDWQDFYHAEYQGFAQVWKVSPANDLTVDYYYSTEGWNTPMSDYQNFLGSKQYREEVYRGTSYDPTKMLTRTNTTYSTNSNACRSTSVTYPACEQVVLETQAIDYEGSNSSSAPYVQHDYTYDDYSVQYGLPGGGYHSLLSDSMVSSNGHGYYKKWTYSPNDQTVGTWTYYTVDQVTHSEVDDDNSHIWQCQDTTYDEGAPSGAKTPDEGLPTTVKTYSNSACTATRGSVLTTSYQGYDTYGNAVAGVDGVAAANNSLYSSNGCTLATAPVIKSSAWSQSHYTACTTYDSYNAQPATVTNAFGFTTSTSFDYTQGSLPTSATDFNNQTTSTSYSYDSLGNRYVQVTLPLHTGSYTSLSSTGSGCSGTSTLPCFEIDTKSYQYNTVQSSTFYDSLGRAVETRTPGPGSSYDTLVITTYNDQAHSVWQSVPFEVAHGAGWVDPNGVKDYQGVTPGGTVTFYDALGRAIATQDPLYGSSQEPGIACSATLSGTYTACTNYATGTVSGDANTYASVTSVDPNKHVIVSYNDARGRTVYVQFDSGLYGGTPTLNEQKTIQYNVLNEPTSVVVTDKAPQSGQTITSATTTAQYDDLGRLTQVADPDRGTHNYTLDANGQVLTDVSGTRTIGTNYDLLGRVGCVQDAAPTINATGACSAGNIYVQNTYDSSKLTVSGTTDYPKGQLTQSVSKTYLTGSPGGDSVTTTESYEHDARGRLSAEQLQFGTLPSSWGITTSLPSYLAQYTHNDANQVTTTATSTTPSGQGYTTTQVYDSTTGSLTGVSNNGTATANLATLVYNARAQIDTINYQTSTGSALASDQFGYDANLRPTSTTATWQSGSGTSGAMLSQSRVYDPASNVISLATTQAAVPGASGSGGSESQNFCYDEQNRLVWAGNSGTQPAAGNGTCGKATLSNNLSGASYNNTFVYTHLGQLWQGPLNGTGSQQQYLYCNSQPHELTGLYGTSATCSSKTGQVYTSSYDSWGNVTSRTYSGTTATLTYDLLDHFVSWNAGSNNKELYVYDASGTRVLRRTTNSSGTTMTVYTFGLEEHSYFNAGGHKGDLYYYTLGGRLLGSLDNNNKTIFDLTDALGSVLASFSNAAGVAAIKGNQVFGPYGNPRDFQGNINTAKGFTGQYNDSLTGLDYYNSRYYDQVAGVFLSADVVQGNMQGMNPYAYVSGNPETKNDPTGQMLIDGGIGNTCMRSPNSAACQNAPAGGFGGDYGPGQTQHISTYLPPKPIIKPAQAVQQSSNSPWDWFQKFWHALTGPTSSDEATNPLGMPCGPLTLSFAAPTKVATAQGKKAIGSLQVGERVWAYNAKTHKMELEPIVHVWINHDDDLVDVTIASTIPAKNGKASQKSSEVIHTNQKHPFLTVEQGFVPVSQLHVGMHVKQALGSTGTITKLKAIPGAMKMYNLEIAQDHTFTVGEGEWIVHNCAYPNGPSDQSDQSGGEFDPRGIEGSSEADIINRLPPSATEVPFKPSENIEQGSKWQWQEGGYNYELEVHGPDTGPGAPTGSAASQGWIARVWRQPIGAGRALREYADTNGNWYAAKGMSPAEQTLTHMEIEDPTITPPTPLDDPPIDPPIDLSI